MCFLGAERETGERYEDEDEDPCGVVGRTVEHTSRITYIDYVAAYSLCALLPHVDTWLHTNGHTYRCDGTGV